MAEKPDSEKKKFTPAAYKIVDLSGGTKNRQVRIPTASYGEMELLRLTLKRVYAEQIGAGNLSLEEVVVMCAQAGVVALMTDPHAPRTLPVS